MKKIIIVETWGLGDMVMITPMLGSIRNAFPETRITVVAGSEQAAAVIRGSHLCDDVKIMPLIKMGFLKLLKAFISLRAEGFETAVIATRHNPRTALFLRVLSGIDRIAGDGFPPRRWGYNEWRPVEPGLHRVVSNMNILRSIIHEAAEAPLYFHIDEVSRRRADELWKRFGLEERSVLGIHLGPARSADKRNIPVELCESIIHRFLDAFGAWRVVIFKGPLDDNVLPGACVADKRVVVVDNLPLRIVGGLVSRMNVFLSADTGIGHLAAAVGVPVLTLAGPTEVISTKPWGEKNSVLTTGEKLPCMPCHGTELYGRCPDRQRCMREIDVETVMDVLVKLSGTDCSATVSVP